MPLAAQRLARVRAVPVLAAALVFANGAVQAETGEGLPVWELGAAAFAVSQQAYPGADQQVSQALALPFFIYRGEFLRADRETAGLRALKTERLELDVGFAGAFAARSDAITARRGMPDLGTLIEFGPRLKWSLTPRQPEGGWRLDLPLRGVFDVDAGFAHRGLSAEPELQFERRQSGGWNTSVGLGAVFADAPLARTLYAVDPAFALPDRPAYAACSGLVSWRLTASFSRPLGADWRVFGFGRIDHLGGAANATSPLVRQTTGASLGLGVAYTWKRSQRHTAD